MRRPRYWLRGLLLFCLLIVLLEYVALTWFVPQYLIHLVEQAAGGELSVGHARLSFPSTTALSDLQLLRNTEPASLSIQRVLVRTRGFSLADRALWLDAVEIERPFLRLTRTASGTWVWPNLSVPSRTDLALAAMSPQPWRLFVNSVKIIDGVIEFRDERPATPFHGLLDHISLDVGPVSLPVPASQDARNWRAVAGTQGINWAFRAELVGQGGGASPIYSSGWLDLRAKDLQASFQLAPIDLSAFEPYFQGPREVKVHQATMASTSQWWARANEFNSRIQLEIDGLGEGGVTIRGRPILDVKRLTGQSGAQLKGELNLSGFLDRPAEWHFEFRPGNGLMQFLVKRLLDREVELVKIPLLGYPVRIGLASTSPATMTDIEATSRAIQEAMEILAFPVQEAAPIGGEPAQLPTPSAEPSKAAGRVEATEVPPSSPSAAPSGEFPLPATSAPSVPPSSPPGPEPKAPAPASPAPSPAEPGAMGKP